MPNNSPEHMRYMHQLRWPKRTVEQRFWQKVNVKTPDECWPWKGAVDHSGYGMFWNGERSIVSHRMVLILVGATFPEGKKSLHHCDNPPCCNPNHLYIGTNADNVRDMIERGRHRYPTGEQVNTCKLTAKKVLQIRSRLQNGEKPIALAAEFKVSNTMIYQIKNRRSWRHI